jgi:hypothetical protein
MENEKQFPPKPPGPFQIGQQWFAVCGDGKVLRLLEIERT